MYVKRGSILHGHFDNIEHPKFFVVIGEDSDNLVGFFFVNSRIPISIMRDQEHFDMQMQIKKDSYGFLKYDSFICADKINAISKGKLEKDISKNMTQLKGVLTNEDLEMLLSASRNSKLFSDIEKETFLQ